MVVWQYYKNDCKEKRNEEKAINHTFASGIPHNTRKAKGSNHLLSQGDYLMAAVQESSTYDQARNC